MIEEIIEKAKKENKKVYVYSHKFPDGDAISSSCAVVQYMKNQGVSAKYIVKNQIRSFSQIVGNISTTSSIEADQISLILDTSTVSYAENTLFKTSSPENTYVIDHHGKVENSKCIEDELGLSNNNVIRDSNTSSVCEILANKLEKHKTDSQIANMLTLGLLTDTAKLKFLKENTLQNLSKLLSLGADYKKIINLCTRKANLVDSVGIAQTLLKTKTFPIGDTFGMILSINNHEVNKLYRSYGLRNIQKKIFMMSDIENCSFMCMLSENNPQEYSAEFRSTPIYGNFNVLQLATSHGGGGHYNASGCTINSESDHMQSSIETSLQKEISELYTNQAKDLPPQTLNKYDLKLSEILKNTKHLTKFVTPDVLSKVDSLVKSGANYDYVFKQFKTFEKFMLQNELLSKISYNTYTQRRPNVNIALSKQEVDTLTKKYNVSEYEILSAIDTFSNININSATVSLPNEKSSHIDFKGNITIDENSPKQDISMELS